MISFLDDYKSRKYSDCNIIRSIFRDMLQSETFITDKSGVKLLELPMISFHADENYIFGKPNEDYIKRELEWYKSGSLSVKTFPGGAPKIWEQVADNDGKINSNYGHLVWSVYNGEQYNNVLAELNTNRDSRRATMIYTRPSIWSDYNWNGRSDFICTNAVGYLIRNNKLHAHVQMRSNDCIFGYRNDYAWQKFILDELASDLEIESGDIIWSATSFHIYERHFKLIEEHYVNKLG